MNEVLRCKLLIQSNVIELKEDFVYQQDDEIENIVGRVDSLAEDEECVVAGW